MLRPHRFDAFVVPFVRARPTGSAGGLAGDTATGPDPGATAIGAEPPRQEERDLRLEYQREGCLPAIAERVACNDARSCSRSASVLPGSTVKTSMNGPGLPGSG
jgi:hypothetical protein